jgi:hypothetical protein
MIKKLSNSDEDVMLMALYHYQLIAMGESRLHKTLKKINKLIKKITKAYPKYD